MQQRVDLIPAWQQTSNRCRSYFTSCTSLQQTNKHVPPFYSPHALLITSRSCQRDAGIAVREALFWQLIAKNRMRRLTLHTALKKSVSETTATTPSGILDRAFVSKQQWSRGLESVLSPLLTQCWLLYQRMVH